MLSLTWESHTCKDSLYIKTGPWICWCWSHFKKINIALIWCDSLIHLSLNNMAANLTDNIFNLIFLNENVWISIEISLEFVPKGPVVQAMAWPNRRQAITWTNVDPIHWLIYATLGEDEYVVNTNTSHMESFLTEGKDLPALQSQSHSCCYPGVVMSQGSHQNQWCL